MPRIDDAGDFPFPLALHGAGNFPEAIMSQRQYPVDTLMIYHCNPLFKRVDSESFKKAFDKIPLIVNFSPFMDETALYSDLILPESTFLERWESTSVASGLGKAVYAVRQPVLKPLYNTLNTGDVIIRLAKKIGKPLYSAFPWKNSEDFVKERVRGIQESGRGSVVSAYSKKFWKKFLEKGGWWETEYKFDDSGKKYNTPSGKFEFFSQIMRKSYEKSNIEEQETIAWGDKMFMPHYEPPRYHGRKMKYPFLLIPFPTASLGSGGGGNQPYLQEIFGGLHGLTGETWVEINPVLAKRLNIADKDQMWVESPRGRIKALAKVYPGMLPDVIHVPLGQGHSAYGRYAKGRGVSPLAIIESQFDPLSGAQVLTGTRVRIYKA
jgi:anaerobic selenocysteine-containing dehydrogenase